MSHSLSLRLAELRDREDFLRMSRSFYEETPFYPSISYSEEKVEKLLHLAVETNGSQCVVILLVANEVPCGMLIGLASEVPFSNDKVASELAWWVDPPWRGRREALQLVDAYEAWAVKVGCSSVAMSLLPTLTDLSKLYERRGYKKTEISYLKGL